MRTNEASAGPKCEMAASSLNPRVLSRYPSTSGARPSPGYRTKSAPVATISGPLGADFAVRAVSLAPMLDALAV